MTRVVILALTFAPLALTAPGLAAAAAAGDAAAPARTPMAGALPPGYTAEYLLGVLLVLALLAAAAWAVRRVQGHVAGGRGSLRVESSLPIGGKERLLVVEVEGERLLLGAGAGGVRTLTRLAARDAPSDVTPAALPETLGPAGGWLARTLRREAP